MSVNAISTGKLPKVGAEGFDLSGLKSGIAPTKNNRAGQPVRISRSSGENAGNGTGLTSDTPLLAGRTTRTREQFESWIGNDANAGKVTAIMSAAKFTNRGDVDSKMIAGLTYIGSGGIYPKSIASVALSLRSEVFQASARLDKALAQGKPTKIKEATYDFNAARSDAYAYFNKYVVKDPNGGLKIPGNPPLTDA